MSTKARMLALTALILIAGGVAVALILTHRSSSDSTSNGPVPIVTLDSTTPDTQSFLAGVPQHGDTLGRATAPATLFVFEDPQCPFCREWSLNALPSVVATFVRSGRVKLRWRGVAIIGPNSVAGLRAAYAAGRQNKLWNVVDQLYQLQGPENSGWITVPVLRQAAANAGADPAAMLAAANSAAVTAELTTAADDAARDKVGGTPTFVLSTGPLAPLKTVRVRALDATTFGVALTAALR